MCGVAGIYHYAEPERVVDRALLERVTRRLAHRGPDDEGFYVRGPLGFGHRRLAIVDLSPTGHQPMAADDEAHWITYNGEFYDHARFRAELAARGVRFRGTSDTETLLYLMRERGVDALAGASGIFAFGFWDARAQRLSLVRDPMGVKQLYYHDDGRRVVFASEVKALLACADVPRAVDPSAVNQYLHFHTPLFDKTFLRDVRAVRAGEVVTFDRGGAKTRTYFALQDFTHRQSSPERAVAQLREELSRVVRDQLLSDVPVGAFFSGGIDSSAVAAYATLAGRRPRCFGVHFSNQGVIDERPYQESAARALGVELELITVDGSAFDRDLLRLMYFQDQPVIGAAMVPMYYVSQLAARNVKVCLGGQAADELFGGYARYGLARPWTVLRSWAGAGVARLRGAPRGGAGNAAVGGNLRKQLLEPRTLARLARRLPDAFDWQARYFNNFAKVPERRWRALFTARGFVSRDECYQTYRETLARSAATDPADLVMHWDAQTYLTGLFQQDDRMSMANSLESRVPLADTRLVRFAFGAGFDLKFRGGATKWLLRQAVADVIPREVLTRRKAGFDTPAERWMRTTHRDFVRDLLLSSRARARGFVDPRAVGELLDRPDQPFGFDMVWKLVCVEAWATIFLDGETPSGVTAIDAVTRDPGARGPTPR